jgi:hypothetical protein
MVDYKGLKENPENLNSFIERIARLERKTYESLSRDAKIAFWLNVYNGVTLKVIIEHYPIKAGFFGSLVYPKNSIRQIDGVWDEITYNVMGRELTLDHIEHEIIRKDFNEPRIHMALVCAAMGCPPLRTEPYVGKKLGQQLDDQSEQFMSNPKKFRIERDEQTVYLSSIFKWFGEDFTEEYRREPRINNFSTEQTAVLNFISKYLSEKQSQYIQAGDYRIRYLDYDWSLNEQE